MKPKILRYFLVLAILSLFALGFVLAKSNLPNNATLAQSRRDNRTLREKAKQRGTFVDSEEPTKERYSALQQLTTQSDVVVIGTPQQNVCRLTPDGKSITTDYKVRVEYSYKGTLREGNIISVSLPGGLVQFEDGSQAEIQTPWFKKMENGHTYLLYLKNTAAGKPFVTTGGPQGVFEIPTTRVTRSIKSNSGLSQDPMWKYHNMNVRAFLKEVRKAVGKRL